MNIDCLKTARHDGTGLVAMQFTSPSKPELVVGDVYWIINMDVVGSH